MRTLRGAAACATTIAIVASSLVSGATAAAAAAPPAAPHTALSAHFEGWGYIDGSFSYEPSRNTLEVYQQTANGFALAMSGSKDSHKHWHNLNVSPPKGTRFAAGQSYPATTHWEPLDSKTVLNISGDGQGCEGAAATTGTLNVHEAAYDDATGKFTAFAADYSMQCSGTDRIAKGEIRFQSAVDYRATDSWEYRMVFGQQPAGKAGTPQQFTVEVNGTLPTTFGAAALAGKDPSAFEVTANTCSGQTLSYGQTCSLTITPKATAVGEQTALLTLAEDSIAGQVTRLLSLQGFDPRDATASPSYLNFGNVAAYDTSAPQSVTLTGSGSEPITFGQSAIAGEHAGSFRVTQDNCATKTLAKGQTCTITMVARPTAATGAGALLSLTDDSVAGATQVSLSVNGYTSDRGTYYPVAPYRVLDSRIGQGGPRATLGTGQTLRLQVAGAGNVPSSASTVVMNVTVTEPVGPGFISIYPTGVSRPTVSSLNFTQGWTGANSVTVKVGADGAINLYNGGAPVHIIADVNGYYSKGVSCCYGPMGGQYHPLAKPVRLADTRTWNVGKIDAGYYINVPASWNSTVNPKVRAFAVNITATEPGAAGFLTAWNGNHYSLPNTSTVNYTANATVPNFAVVPTTPCEDCGSATGWPSIGVYTHADSHIIVDIVGFYDDSTLANGLRFEPIVPTRIADTRTGQGWPSALGHGVTATITAPSPIAVDDTYALATNVTAVQPTLSTFLTLWPANLTGVDRPSTSNLNPSAGAIVPNAVQTMIGPGNKFNIYNNSGTTNVVVDVVGTFSIYPPSAPTGVSTQAEQEGARAEEGPTAMSVVRMKRA